MGLFSKEPCCLCNANKSKYLIIDGKICKECLNKYAKKIPVELSMANMTRQDILKYEDFRKENDIENNNFNTTKKIDNYIEIDDINKKFRIPNTLKVAPTIYSYNEILEYELLEDNETIISGGLGRAITGGLLFGGVGAVVGGVTGKKKSKTVVESLKIKITLNNINSPVLYIKLINQPIKTDSSIYKSLYFRAQEILSCLSALQNNNNIIETESINDESSTVRQIREYKSLLDDGIITEEEFNNKKKELLEA